MKDKEQFLKNLGKHLRKIREGQGMSLREMELNCDMDRQLISKIELGQRNVSATSLKKYADALGLEFEELFKGFRNK